MSQRWLGGSSSQGRREGALQAEADVVSIVVVSLRSAGGGQSSREGLPTASRRRGVEGAPALKELRVRQ